MTSLGIGWYPGWYPSLEEHGQSQTQTTQTIQTGRKSVKKSQPRSTHISPKNLKKYFSISRGANRYLLGKAMRKCLLWSRPCLVLLEQKWWRTQGRGGKKIMRHGNIDCWTSSSFCTLTHLQITTLVMNWNMEKAWNREAKNIIQQCSLFRFWKFYVLLFSIHSLCLCGVLYRTCKITAIMITLLPADFVLQPVTVDDLQIASIAWGFTLGFGFLTVWTAIRQTADVHRRYGFSRLNSTYVWMIWLEILVCLIFCVICWLYLNGIIPPR